MKTNCWVLSLLLIGAAAPLCHSQTRKSIYPDHVVVQYAGSTGWLGVGAGYNLSKDRARLGLHDGFVPEEKGGKLKILSTSFFYKPYILHISDKLDFSPLDIGAKLGYHFGDQFYINWPSRFPKGYYWWKSALGLHLATETSVTFKLKVPGRAKAVTAYLELNSSDLYLVSYIQNFKSLTLPDIVKAGVGLRVTF
jgi:hypothetical protein